MVTTLWPADAPGQSTLAKNNRLEKYDDFQPRKVSNKRWGPPWDRENRLPPGA